MTDGRRRWLAVPRSRTELPADLVAVAALTLGTAAAATLPALSETPLRAALGLAFVLVAPGYALVAALFPGGSNPGANREHEGRPAEPTATAAIDGVERVALSVGCSVALTPLLGLVLNATPWGIRLVPILLVLGGVTLALTAVAVGRRLALPAHERFRVPYRAWASAARRELLEPESRGDAALNVLLVASILLAVGAVGVAAAVPHPGGGFTELYLLTETPEGDGGGPNANLTAADYPTEYVVGESRSLVLGVSNHEHTTTTYSVVITLQNVTLSEDGGNVTGVRDQRRLDRLDLTLAHNETVHRRVAIAPRTAGEDRRLAFLLYRGEPPAEPSLANADRETHLWIDVAPA